MKHILISGATSFIGLKLTDYLLSLGHYVTGVVRKHSDKVGILPKSDLLRVVELNLENYSKLGQAVDGPVDCYIHLTWNGTRGVTRDDAEQQKCNYQYSMAAVRSIIESGCGKIISAGSQAEYGICVDMVTEEHTCQPVTQYGKWKLRFYQEASALCLNAGIPMIEPRFFSLYGPGDFENTMIISILKKMLAGEPCDLTRGIQMWDFLHIVDAVAAVAALIEQDVPAGVYNFGSEDTRILRDFIVDMKRCTHSKSVLNFGAIPYPETGMVSIQPNSTKLREVTGWKPRISFEQGIYEIVEHMR